MKNIITQSAGRASARTYRICGIAVRSDWDLPYCERQDGAEALVELVESSRDALGDAATEAATLASSPAWYRITHLHDGSTFLHFPELFDFLVSADGRLVLGYRLTDADPESFYVYLLGHALSYALVEFGMEPLHATCVMVNGSAVAFLGDTGYGKSTLAAAFVRAGHPLVTDDMLVLRAKSGGFYASPGLSRIKLYPETAEQLLGSHVRGAPMNPHTNKMVIPLEPHQFHREDVGLAGLYVLAAPSSRGGGADVKISALSKYDAFVELCKASFNSYASTKARSERQFLFATEVASTVPVRLLSFGNGLGLLTSVRNAVLSDLG